MKLAMPTRRNTNRAGPAFLLALGLCWVLSGAMAGCEGEKASPRQVRMAIPSEQPVPPAAVPEAPAPESEQPDSSALQAPVEATPITVPVAKTKRDPFKSFVMARPEGGPVQKEQAPKITTPLQRYSLDQLKVVGIIAGDNMRKALLEDDVGKGYVVSVGDAVGSEGGQITAILQDRIVIEGTYRDLMGNEKTRRVTKKLYISDEGENP